MSVPGRLLFTSNPKDENCNNYESFSYTSRPLKAIIIYEETNLFLYYMDAMFLHERKYKNFYRTAES